MMSWKKCCERCEKKTITRKKEMKAERKEEREEGGKESQENSLRRYVRMRSFLF